MTEFSRKCDQRVAVVTGAAQGIGCGVATALANSGVWVFLWDVAEKVHNTAKSLQEKGFKAWSRQVDITKIHQIRDAVEEIKQIAGTIDILVNNAGIARFAPFLKITPETRDAVMDVNFHGTWNCSQAVLPAMIAQRFGRIVNISSVTGPRVGDPGLSVYAASKGAVSGLTRNLAIEMAAHGITVNAILPGFIDTPLIQPLAEEMNMSVDQARQCLAQINPTKRLGSIEDIGNLCVFLSSENAGHLTGQEIVIDGGSTIMEKSIDS